MSTDKYRAALDAAAKQLSCRALSAKMLRDKLIAKGHDEEAADYALAWLAERSLLSDAQFAESVVRSYTRRGYGAARAKSILYEKGIPKELWDEALEELPEMDGAIDTFLRRKLDGRTLDAKQIKKTVDALLRRGHSYHDIQAGLRRYEASLSLEQTQEDTWEDME